MKTSINELNADIFQSQTQDKHLDSKSARKKAMDFLAIREYGQKELIVKLQSKGFPRDISHQAVERLTKDGLQNDTRFVESFCCSRVKQGKGPLKIMQELEEKKVPSSIVYSVLDEMDVDWINLAIEVRVKKFGSEPPSEFKEKAKQMRFLQSRGFENQHIRKAVRD